MKIKKNKKNLIFFLGVVILITLTLVSILIFQVKSPQVEAKSIQAMELSYPEDAKVVTKELNMTNDEESFYMNEKKVSDEIRVSQNTLLRVIVKNETEYSTSVHFHGVDGLSKMDGIGGITQDDIAPGETFTYEFYLDQPGTYMYHSHTDSAEQVNNEYLFGTLVVEDEEESNIKNKDSLIFNAETDVEAHHNAAGASNFVTVNGEDVVEKKFSKDEDIYLNIVNMSSVPISINFGKNVEYKITNVDAHDVTSEEIKDKDLIIPAANRVEVEIKNPGKSFVVSSSLSGKKNAQFGININGTPKYTDYSDIEEKIIETEMDGAMMGGGSEVSLATNAVYLYNVIESKEEFNLENEKVDKKFELDLGMTSNDSWGINDKTYEESEPIVIDEGDIVEVELTNDGDMGEPHPFHLHGHEFQVTKYNGEEVNKSIILDTVNVRSDESITIKFRANNPGIWPLHCHDLTHADKGMMILVKYRGYYSEAEA